MERKDREKKKNRGTEVRREKEKKREWKKLGRKRSETVKVIRCRDRQEKILLCPEVQITQSLSLADFAAAWPDLNPKHDPVSQCPFCTTYLLVVLNAHADSVHKDRDHDPTVEVLAVHDPSKLHPNFPPHVTTELHLPTFFHFFFLFLQHWGTLVTSAAFSLCFTVSSIFLVWVSAVQDRQPSGCVMFPPMASGAVGEIRGCCHSNGLDQALRRAVKRIVLLANSWGDKWLRLKEKALFPPKKCIQAGYVFGF